MEQTPHTLAEEKIGKLMRKYAVPCVISLLVGALYNIVDQIFICLSRFIRKCRQYCRLPTDCNCTRNSGHDR